MQGILLVDKPLGWTSFDVVNYVRKIVAAHEAQKPKNIKVGHAGTLDPLATGLLVLLVGQNYTRRASQFSKLSKSYEVTMRLGQTSTTADEEGEKVFVSNKKPAQEEIETILQHFKGEIMQTPPIYSAMKVDGQRAYKLARAGKSVVLKSRPITIHTNQLISYHYPLVSFTAEVSSGTYIRSLVEDIGQALGTGAYTSALRRVRIGQFDIDKSIAITDNHLLEQILP